ncbi:hypothetical protein D0Z03_000655 [Geotrichum reessii]|nr:hypothetical protein D0Z03_000655 [Galactomyces reessii]
MTEVAPLTVSFGDELKDGFKPVEAWISQGIRWLDDIHAFYQERATIEKEYAQRLTALSSKYFEKKARISTILSVGENPVVTPGSLESASLVTWSEVLNQTEALGKERARLANELGLQVADQINGVALKFDDLKKKYVSYHERLIEERDSLYSDLKKSKANYDTACQGMENLRVKASRSHDKSKDKANRKMAEKEIEMNNEKNVYLIKINVANRIKDKYYHEDVPELLDHMQSLNEARVQMLNHFWNQAIEFEQGCLDRSKTCLESITAVVKQNDPALDSAMFVKHNVSQWTEPTDFYYQPSPIWHDDENMITNDVALQYLRKRLVDSQNKYAEHEKTSHARIESYKSAQEQKKTAGNDLLAGKISRGSYLEFLTRSLSALQAVTYNETKKTIEEVEIETIEIAAGDKDLNSITPVAEVKKRKGLFGLLKGKSDGHSSTSPAASLRPVTSTSTMATGHSGNFDENGKHKGGFLASFRHKSKSKSVSSGAEEMAKVRMLYDYTPTGDAEIAATVGEELQLIDGDDGSGWLEVRSLKTGMKGLVPTSYTEEVVAITKTNTNTSSIMSGAGSGKKGPVVAPKRGAKKVNYMIALYNYDAQNEDEITIQAGDKIAVVSEDVGDGWTEGELNGMRGSFPTAYARSA